MLLEIVNVIYAYQMRKALFSDNINHQKNVRLKCVVKMLLEIVNTIYSYQLRKVLFSDNKRVPL